MYSLAQFWVGSVPVCVHVNWKTPMAKMSTRSTRPETSQCLIQMDSILMLGKTLQLMTPSEFHTCLVGQHSTLSGAIIGLFIFFGVKMLLRSALFTFPEAYVGVWLNGIQVCDGHCRCDSTTTFVSYCVFLTWMFITHRVLQAPSNHLIIAIVIGAPAVIGITKLSWSETETSCTKSIDDIELEPRLCGFTVVQT